MLYYLWLYINLLRIASLHNAWSFVIRFCKVDNYYRPLYRGKHWKVCPPPLVVFIFFR